MRLTKNLLQVQLDPLGGFKCLLDSYAGLPDCTLPVKGQFLAPSRS